MENSKTTKGRTRFYAPKFLLLGASIFHLLPLSLRNINSIVPLRKALDGYYSDVIFILLFNDF